MTGLSVPTEAPRKPGDRCCAPAPRPTLDARATRRLTSDLQLLAHPVRLRILSVLAGHEGRVCVCDLEAAVPVKQPTVSHHLRLLREAGLVDSEKRGLWAYYFINRSALDAIRRRVGEGLGDVMESRVTSRESRDE